MGTLELREDAGGRRHYLDDQPVHAGDLLELCLSGGTWLVGRYEWSFDADTPPSLFVPLGSPDGELEEQAPIKLPAAAALRRPGRNS